jgi:hypothetical protein
MWQKERDAIEEEVVIFDGGDLERMKQKTRGRLDQFWNLADSHSRHRSPAHRSLHRARRRHARLDCSCRPLTHSPETSKRGAGSHSAAAPVGRATPEVYWRDELDGDRNCRHLQRDS